MAMADQVQVAVRGGGRPQRNSASHTAARRLLCSLMEGDGLPVAQSREVIDDWMNRTVNTAIRRYQAAIHILHTPSDTLFAAADVTTPGTISPEIPVVVPASSMVDVEAGADPLADLDNDSAEDSIDPLQGFISLACLAGFAENKEPVGVWLQQTWGVTSVAKLSHDDLTLILDQYEGVDGAERFHDDVMGVSTAATALGPFVHENATR